MARLRCRGALQRAGWPALLAVAVTACSSPIGAGDLPALESSSPSPSGATSVSASPGFTASPSGTGTPANTAGPTTPGATVAPPVGPPGTSAGPTVAAPVSCTTPGSPPPNPVRVARVTPQGRRATEVVTVVSDGRAVTSGAREQSDFTSPALFAPDGTPVADQAVLQRAASLVAAAARTKVLVSRPEGPDAGVDPSKKPFNTAGTYALYNASIVLVAEVIVQCGGTEQTWSFTVEGNPAVGQVNCAVEPGKGNPVARAVYASSC